MPTEDLSAKGLRIDDLQIKGYKLVQDPKAFCFGMDAVLLSGFAADVLNEDAAGAGSLCDLCSGNGVIPVLMAAKTEVSHIVGLEIIPENVQLANRSIEMNELSGRVSMVTGDLKEASRLLGKSVFDAVTVNPPYMEAGRGLVSPNTRKACARTEILCTLEDVIRESSRLLKPMGSFFAVHRPGRLTELLSLMRQYGIEPKRLRMVHSHIDDPATMVLAEGRSSKGRQLVVERPLVIYDELGNYTPDVKGIYGD